MDPIQWKNQFPILDDDLPILGEYRGYANKVYAEFLQAFSSWLYLIGDSKEQRSFFLSTYESIVQSYQEAFFARERSKISAANLISKMSLTLEKLARGEVDFVYEASFGEEQFSKAVNALIERMRCLIEDAHNIAQGNFKPKISILGAYDELGIAFVHLSKKLDEMDREKKAEAAIKRQISLWDDFIKGEHNLYVFAQKTISFLCRYLRAITGTFYLLFDDEGEKALRIVGTYVANTNRRRGMESSLKENYLLRRVEMEKEVVVILDAPDERLGLITCFGNLLPQNIAIFPIIIDEEVVALLEVGSSKIFSNNDLEFAKRMCTIASSSIRSHNARGQIRNLLEQSKAQTLKLETQRERLKRKPEKA